MLDKLYIHLNKVFKLSFSNEEHEIKFQQQYLQNNLKQNIISIKTTLIIYIGYYFIAYYITPNDFLFNAMYTLPIPILLAIFLLASKQNITNNYLLKLFIFACAIAFPQIINIPLTEEYHQIYMLNFMLIIFGVYITFGAPFVLAFLIISFLLLILLVFLFLFSNLQSLFYIYLLFMLITTFILSTISGYVVEQTHRKNYLAIFKQEELMSQIKREQEKNKKQTKRLHEQARLAQMGEMISMIAHQWRQPLSAIRNTSIAIQLKQKKKPLDTQEKQEVFNHFMHKKLRNIDKFVTVLSETIDDFRNFFKPDRNKEVIALTDPIEKALNIVSSSFFNNNITIKTNFYTKEKVGMYQNEMVQVILNLLKNAEDNFLEKNIQDATISIATYKIESYYAIEISDNGKGIPPHILPYIFDPYFSTKEEKNGSGLGLYMSKTIIEEHHKGKLEIKNIDNGVSFRIVLYA